MNNRNFTITVDEEFELYAKQAQREGKFTGEEFRSEILPELARLKCLRPQALPNVRKIEGHVQQTYRLRMDWTLNKLLPCAS